MRMLTEQVQIDAPARAVWHVLADFGGVCDWAPYMRRSWLIGDLRSGVGTRRGMRHFWGFRFEESVTAWQDGEGYSFDVLKAPFPMTDVHETWVCAAASSGTTVTTRVSYGMRLGLLGSAVDWLLVRFIVQREMRTGLRGLKEYVERNS